MITLEFTYVVQSDDTLFLIAKRFNTSVDAIISRNNIVNPSLIYPGQILIIPVNGIYYTVIPGDSVYLIGQQFGVPYEPIIYVNNIVYPYTIYPGQVLFIPGAAEPVPPTPPTPPTPCPFYYVINPGDTLWDIANRFGVSLDALIRANYLVDPNLIYPGQTIIIPCPSTPSPMPGAPTPMPGTPMPSPGTPTPTPGTSFPMPPVTTPIPPTTGRMVYIIKPGDTIYTIATKFNTTVDAILKANSKIKDPSLIYPGQKIVIPVIKEDVKDVDMAKTQEDDINKDETKRKEDTSFENNKNNDTSNEK